MSKVTGALILVGILMSQSGVAETAFQLQLRSRSATPPAEIILRDETWDAERTAIIVCDTWDYHHCLNAVRRLEEFAPTMDKVLQESRRRGAIIIHAPSDCMPAYQNHPARKRAIDTPAAPYSAPDIGAWCSVIPTEEGAIYPIDQSDGGEDDDPQEHAEWAAKLKSLGRNPNMPWLKQSDMITIDSDKDFISDRGDEVWNILHHHQIDNVILAGVHTNMCVLGRPFGLRQMARNGKNVVLMRDMTDTMYNPQRWPYVSHFEGTRRIIAHIEAHVCPTISSDQILGGKPFRFQGDDGSDVTELVPDDPRKHWVTVDVPESKPFPETKQDRWYRCVVQISDTWAQQGLALELPTEKSANVRVWCNGSPCNDENDDSAAHSYNIPHNSIEIGDWNLLTVRLPPQTFFGSAPILRSGEATIQLTRQWQTRIGNDPDLKGIPLPAKFGGASDVAYQLPDPLWIPRPLTRRMEFTAGIECPACAPDGTLYVVNYQSQGTIGRVSADGSCDVFASLPTGSIGNGIRFANSNHFFVADYTHHNVLKVDRRTRQISVHCHNGEMNQPNDLAISRDGTLYASDPNWQDGTGQIWKIRPDGSSVLLASELGTTNGIEISPDESTLYVNESQQRAIWAYTIGPDAALSDKRLLIRFPDHGLDGMRCDVDGNLYVTRHGKGTVAVLSPNGELTREIQTLGSRPSNLCFGGPDGRTVYVTEVDAQRIVSFRADRPGRSFSLNESK